MFIKHSLKSRLLFFLIADIAFLFGIWKPSHKKKGIGNIQQLIINNYQKKRYKASPWIGDEKIKFHYFKPLGFLRNRS